MKFKNKDMKFYSIEIIQKRHKNVLKSKYKANSYKPRTVSIINKKIKYNVQSKKSNSIRK